MTRRASMEKPKSMTLGLSRFARISAVEGVCLSDAAKHEFSEDDRRQTTPAERRQRIIAKYTHTKA